MTEVETILLEIPKLRLNTIVRTFHVCFPLTLLMGLWMSVERGENFGDVSAEKRRRSRMTVGEVELHITRQNNELSYLKFYTKDDVRSLCFVCISANTTLEIYLSEWIFEKEDLDSVYKYPKKWIRIWIVIVFDLDNLYPRSRSQSYSSSHLRRHGRGFHAGDGHQSKSRAPKIEYLIEFRGSDGYTIEAISSWLWKEFDDRMYHQVIPVLSEERGIGVLVHGMEISQLFPWR
ncbi:hypothetical protein LguiA_017757 [Lonicera macranthoides]